jgi:hypothetical protein
MKKFNYSIESGLTRVKTRTKKYIAGALSGLAIAGGVAMPVMALSPTVSDQASNAACFGQARAAYAKGGPNSALLPEGVSNGDVISTRKGNNPAENAWYIANFCQ